MVVCMFLWVCNLYTASNLCMLFKRLTCCIRIGIPTIEIWSKKKNRLPIKSSIYVHWNIEFEHWSNEYVNKYAILLSAWFVLVNCNKYPKWKEIYWCTGQAKGFDWSNIKVKKKSWKSIGNSKAHKTTTLRRFKIQSNIEFENWLFRWTVKQNSHIKNMNKHLIYSFPFIISCRWSCFCSFNAPFWHTYLECCSHGLLRSTWCPLNVQFFSPSFAHSLLLGYSTVTMYFFFRYKKNEISKMYSASIRCSVLFDMICTRTFNKYDFSALYIVTVEVYVQQMKNTNCTKNYYVQYVSFNQEPTASIADVHHFSTLYTQISVVEFNTISHIQMYTIQHNPIYWMDKRDLRDSMLAFSSSMCA